MDKTTRSNKLSPEKIVLGVLTSELKFNLTSSKRKEALVTMIRSLDLLFRDLGIPQKWIRKIRLIPDTSTNRIKRDSKSIIPKKASKLVDALFDLCKSEHSSELAFWLSETLAEVNTILDGKLIRYLIQMNQNSIVREIMLLASSHFEEILLNGDTSSIQTLIRFAGKIPSCERLFEDELQRIKKSSLTRLPEISRRFLTSEDIPDATFLVHMSDPSQSVEVRQFAHLLQSSWMRHHEGGLDSATFDSLRAFGKGFKNLEFVGSFEEEAKYSDEYFEGKTYRAGESVIIKVPPVIWRLGDKLKVIVRGIVKPKS